MKKDKSKKKIKECEIILRSITKEFRNSIYSKFLAAIDKYKLIQNGDKVCVCISGGKDSILLAECFKIYSKYMNKNFEVKYLVMNPGYSKENINLIKENIKKLDIKCKIVNTDIFEIATSQDNSPCYLCARMRRGALYRIAKDLGCNKIALGHHYDDVIETNLINLFYAGSIQTMLPKNHSDNFEGMELIRPFYFVREKSIIEWANYHNLKFLNCACKFTQNNYVDIKHSNSKRFAIKNLIKELSEKNNNVDKNIFSALENVNLDKVLNYKKNGKFHSFLDDYDK